MVRRIAVLAKNLRRRPCVWWRQAVTQRVRLPRISRSAFQRALPDHARGACRSIAERRRLIVLGSTVMRAPRASHFNITPVLPQIRRSNAYLIFASEELRKLMNSFIRTSLRQARRPAQVQTALEHQRLAGSGVLRKQKEEHF